MAAFCERGLQWVGLLSKVSPHSKAVLVPPPPHTHLSAASPALQPKPVPRQASRAKGDRRGWVLSALSGCDWELVLKGGGAFFIFAQLFTYRAAVQPCSTVTMGGGIITFHDMPISPQPSLQARDLQFLNISGCPFQVEVLPLFTHSRLGTTPVSTWHGMEELAWHSASRSAWPAPPCIHIHF